LKVQEQLPQHIIQK